MDDIIWTRVSEKLPPYNGTFYVTVSIDPTHADPKQRYTTTSYFYGGKFRYPGLVAKQKGVIAWALMPEQPEVFGGEA